MPSKIEPRYPHLDQNIPDKGFIEKYGAIILAIIAIMGTSGTVYTSLVTKLEITKLKQEYNEASIKLLQEHQDRNENVIIDNEKKFNEKLQKLSDRISELDSSTSRSVSDIYNKINKK